MNAGSPTQHENPQDREASDLGAAAPGAAGAQGAVGAARQALEPLKPHLRGWLHAGMFPAVLFSGIFLTALAESTRGRIACAVYALTACLLFGVSGLYHRGNWGPGRTPSSGGWTTPTSS